MLVNTFLRPSHLNLLLKNFPTVFLRDYIPDTFQMQKDPSQVAKMLGLEGYQDGSNLHLMPSDKNAFFKIAPTPGFNRQHPVYLYMHLLELITPKEYSTISDAMRTWIKHGKPEECMADHRRSHVAGAYHDALWCGYYKEPFFSKDAIKYDEDPWSWRIREEYLRLVRGILAPRVLQVIRAMDPNLYHLMKWHVILVNYSWLCSHCDIFNNSIYYVAHQWLKSEGKTYRNDVDFNGAFFGLAYKIGSSENIHIDLNDAHQSLTWVMAFGDDCDGGHLCLPELHTKLSLRPCSVIAFSSRFLAHYASPHTGERLSMTMFTHRRLVDFFLMWREEQNSIQGLPAVLASK